MQLSNKPFLNSSSEYVPYAMKISSDTGLVKWVKVFNLGKTSKGYLLRWLQITGDQVAWFVLTSSNVSFVYRLSSEGTLLQIIWFGSTNIFLPTTITFLNVISESEFMFTQELSLLNSNISISQTTGTDFSIAKISTDLNVQ